MNDTTGFDFEEAEIPILMQETNERAPIAGHYIAIPTFHVLLDVSKQFSWHTADRVEIRVREDIQVRFFHRGGNIVNRSWIVRNYFTLSELESALNFLKPSFDPPTFLKLEEYITKLRGGEGT